MKEMQASTLAFKGAFSCTIAANIELFQDRIVTTTQEKLALMCIKVSGCSDLFF